MTTYRASLRILPGYLDRIEEYATVSGRLGLGNIKLSTRYFEELLQGSNPNAKGIRVEKTGDVLEVSCKKRLFGKMYRLDVTSLLEYATPIENPAASL